MTSFDYYLAAAVVGISAIKSFKDAARYDLSRGLQIFYILAGLGFAVLAYRLWNAA